jgi:hypothetical protein
MFSFCGDTVLDPFAGTGTTMLAAMRAGRNSIGVEIELEYANMAAQRLREETSTLFPTSELQFLRAYSEAAAGGVTVKEEPAPYKAARPKPKRTRSRHTTGKIDRH